MNTLIILFTLTFSSVFAQLETKQISVPPKFTGRIEPGHEVRLNGEYNIDLYYIDPTILKRPRFMAIGRNGVLYVADLRSRDIYRIPDADGDGVGDTMYTATAVQVDSVHSIYIWHDTLYAAEPSRVRKFIDTDRDGLFESETPFIAGIHSTGPYNHYTRTVLVDTVNRQLYLSVGASCNACREENYQRATIQQYSLNGAVSRTYASGLRNAIGLAIDPETDSPWATNADRDGLGDDIPPEIISPIVENGFYGWPFAYGHKVWVDFNDAPEYQALLPISKADSQLVDNMEVAPIMLEAHSTPMAIIFYHDPRIYFQQPPKTMLVARHGSSKNGRSVGLGYDVLRFQQNKETTEWARDTFITGFLTDPINYDYWGRPCGLVQDSIGQYIYLSSDAGIPAIYRISLKDFSKVERRSGKQSFSIFPNPAQKSFKVITPLDNANIKIFTVLGNEVRSLIERTSSGYEITLKDYTPGIHFCRFISSDSTYSLPVIVQ